MSATHDPAGPGAGRPLLDNPRADRVKAVRALAGRPARVRHGQFLVEGPQAVRELVLEDAAHVRDLYLTEAAADRYEEILAAARAAGVRTHLATPAVLDAMSPDAQHVLAVAQPRAVELEAVLAGSPRLVAVLSRVRDPGNAGAVIRAADAAGADAVVLTAESVDVHNPKVVRSTAGSLFHLPVVTGVTLADAVAALRSGGLAVLAADGAGEHDLDDLLDVAGQGSTPGLAVATGSTATPGSAPATPGSAAVVPRSAATPDLARPTAWVFGNEAWGLPDADRTLADAAVRVPIRGRAESLNLATAATVCLYASSRAQR
ncbi:RNA methyltransferase [Cellulomonas cellasea]|uniref:TrmH family RNA methyltransferase n=1 Tax=Cellulomonas cellasea TaxID=43670 RepID=A0A7W4YDZ1_9CELL|nr:RNA methyltransferase [Cellulomonas cellasea]MBB2925162.1 TrmH family RNA methyltransferase [Cellulomonas cellasea]